MKTVGIIGGLGPETTAEFYLELVFGMFKKSKIARPSVLLWSVPLPYKIEEDLLLHARGEERYIPFLQEAAQQLEKGGADFIVLPCNSLHVFIKEIRERVNIPVLSILEETAHFLEEKNISRAGIIATPSAVQKKLYENELEKRGIGQVLPNQDEQSQLGKIINTIVLNQYADKERMRLNTIIASFKKKEVKTVILACTDLQLVVTQQPGITVFDTMKILANATIKEMMK